MLQPDELIHAGAVLKPHGYKGEVKVIFMANVAHSLKRNRWFFLMIRKKPVPFFVEKYAVISPDAALVKFEDCNSPEEALALKDHEVWLQKKSLPHSLRQELAKTNLIDYEVYDPLGSFLGKVEDIMESAKQQILVIRHGQKEFLLPNVGQFIRQVDDIRQQIIADVPDELMELETKKVPVYQEMCSSWKPEEGCSF